ncbi:MAG: FCD domain-containing protein [Sneathiella sp.]
MKSSQTSSSNTLFDQVSGDPLAEKAAQQIEEHILSGVLKEGSRLPSERDLAVQLDISRPKLREAVQLLEKRGLIDIIAGQGLYISQLSGPVMLPALVALYTRHPAALQDHLEYRRHQDGLAARLAAERATLHDRDRLLELVSKMKQAHSNQAEEAASDLDSRFHMAIAEASYNRTLIHMMTSLYDLNRQSIFFNRQELFANPQVASDLLEQHEAIANAIVKTDYVQAGALAMDHVDYVRDALLEVARKQERETVSRRRAIL